MIFTVFKETWIYLMRHTKNRLTLILVFVALLAYSAFFLPRMNSFNTIDLEKLEQSVISNEGISATIL